MCFNFYSVLFTILQKTWRCDHCDGVPVFKLINVLSIHYYIFDVCVSCCVGDGCVSVWVVIDDYYYLIYMKCECVCDSVCVCVRVCVFYNTIQYHFIISFERLNCGVLGHSKNNTYIYTSIKKIHSNKKTKQKERPVNGTVTPPYKIPWYMLNVSVRMDCIVISVSIHWEWKYGLY